jgi:hypothetical protein
VFTSDQGPPRVTVLADSDTRWKWGALTAMRLVPDGELTGRVLRGRATPTERQLADAGVPGEPPREVTHAEFLAEAAEQTDGVVVLACVGGTVQAMLHGLAYAWRGATRRPVVVTGYVGVVYEKLADGLLLRAGADVVLANSTHDAERFRAVYAGAGADPETVVEAALPFLDGDPYRPAAPGERPYTVVFAVQPSVPRGRSERGYILERVVEHARRHPERDVLIKLRSLPGEQTTHTEDTPYQRLVAHLETPPNLRLVYGHMGTVLDSTDLLVTVSSTAAMEAMQRGIPTAVLTDLGIREALGNHHFLGAGVYASWDDLDAGAAPQADRGWLARHGAALTADPYAVARARIAELAAAEKHPALAPYYTPTSAPRQLPALLARNHLDIKGEPLPELLPVNGRGPVRAALRGVVRGVARTAYRQGAQRVAPAIRRWGQL